MGDEFRGAFRGYFPSIVGCPVDHHPGKKPKWPASGAMGITSSGALGTRNRWHQWERFQRFWSHQHTAGTGLATTAHSPGWMISPCLVQHHVTIISLSKSLLIDATRASSKQKSNRPRAESRKQDQHLFDQPCLGVAVISPPLRGLVTAFLMAALVRSTCNDATQTPQGRRMEDWILLEASTRSMLTFESCQEVVVMGVVFWRLQDGLLLIDMWTLGCWLMAYHQQIETSIGS